MSLDTEPIGAFARTVSTFQANLKDIEQTDIRPLPELADQLQHTGKFFRVAENLAPGLYVDTGHAALRTLLHEPARIWFQSQIGKRIGREDSHNNVFFGRAWTEPQNSPDGHLQIAVKSKEIDKVDSILGELAAFQYIGGLLMLPTFRPAFLLVSDSEVSLGTHFDGPVYTMDTVEWRKLSDAERWQELGPAIDTAAMLHTKSLFHGDLYFRNVGFYETGKTVIVDPEHTVSARDDIDELSDAGLILTDGQKQQQQHVKRLMSQDFSALVTSIESNIVSLMPKRNKPRNGEARLKVYRKHLYEPYKQMLQDTDTPQSKVLLRVYDEMMVDLKERARKDII